MIYLKVFGFEIMIDFRELRVGNWVNEQGLELQVGMIHNDLFSGTEPIPLTIEWLERFGFVGDSILGTQTLYKNNGVEIWVFRNDNTFLVDNIKRKSVYLKYVHQLQNLYFALTGRELKL